MRPSDYANFKITKPTNATIRVNADHFKDELQQIVFEYIMKHFVITGEQRTCSHQMIFKITDDELFEMFNCVVDEAKKILVNPIETSRLELFKLEIIVNYLNEDFYNSVFFTRELVFDSGNGYKGNDWFNSKSSISLYHLNGKNK